jgi:Na+/H+ antiporter NhaC
MGSSLGTAVSRAVRAATAALDLHSAGAGISTTLVIGAILCGAVFIALLIHAVKKRPCRAAAGRRSSWP